MSSIKSAKQLVDSFITAFHFNCNLCNQSFNVYFENMTDKEKIICPNCDSVMDSKAVTHFKNAAREINQATTELEKSTTKDSHWSFSLKWNIKNLTPDKTRGEISLFDAIF